MKKQRALSTLLAGVVSGLLSPALASGTPDAIGSTRSTLAKWVETKQIISREQKEWELGREVLEQRIALLEGEIASVRGKISETRQGIDEADGKQRNLSRENRGLRGATTALLDGIGRLETETRQLLVSVPTPLAQRVEPLSRRIPKDSASTELSLSQRFQNVLGILNEVNKFNREVVVTREIRDIPGGATAEVETLYLGLGQAYYVTPNRDAAGSGRPGPDGWQWTAADDLADRVAQAIAIVENDDVPAYVPLPVEVQ